MKRTPILVLTIVLFVLTVQTAFAQLNTDKYHGGSNDGSGVGTSSADIPVPVEVAVFTASIQNTAVHLKWRTSSEVNNYGFEIERRWCGEGEKGGDGDWEKRGNGETENRGNGEWEKIGFVEGHGTTNAPKDYAFVDSKISVAGKYWYRLKQIDRDGGFRYSPAIEVGVEKPQRYELSQNYPNPFNPSTTIRFAVPEESFVTLTVHNVLEQTIKTFVNERKPAGFYEMVFDASELPSGIYFYRLEAGSFQDVKTMVMVK
jgi:hypothetical protein